MHVAASPGRAAVASAPATPPVRTWIWWWLLLALVWGSSFLLIKVSLGEFSPVQVAFGRCSFGAAAVLAFMALTHTRLPGRRSTWGHAAVVALVFNTIPFTLFSWAEQSITSTLAGIFNATTPLFTAVFALLIIPSERIDRNRVAGLAIGFVGVMMVLGVFGAGQAALQGDLAGSLACIGATACYGIGIPYTRRFLTGTGDEPASIVGAQLLWASLQLGVLCLLFSPMPTTVRLGPVLALAVLGILATGLAYVLNYRIIRDVGSLPSAAVTYATPVVSTVEGTLLLGEPLTWNQPVGALVVLAGVALVQGIIRPFGR